MILVEILFWFLCFLFSLFLFSKDDFVLFRRNVTSEKMFNLAFLTGFIVLLFARFFYVAFHFDNAFFNPLAFLLFPYFPGLHVPAGVAVGCLFLYLYIRRKNMPTGRVFDIFLLSLVAVFPFGLFFALFRDTQFSLSFVLLFPLFFFLIFFFCLQYFRKADLRDGSVGFLCLLSFFALSLATLVIVRVYHKSAFVLPEDVVSVVGMLISVFFLLRNEKLLPRALLK